MESRTVAVGGSDALACGANASGQLGVGDAVTRTLPTSVSGRRPWRSLAVGDSHCAGVSSDGALYAWGLNDRGQCGVGDTLLRLAPARVEAVDAESVQVACGYEHTVLLTADGNVLCFGSNEYGQCGLANSASTLLLPRAVSVPRAEGRVTAVACGSHHTLALTSAGALYAWGQNLSGQLGTGDKEDRHTPTLVASLWGVVVCHVSAGSHHSLAISLSGDAWAWGRAAGGALGLTEAEDSPAEEATTPHRPAPAAVVASLLDLGFAQDVAERAASATHSAEDAVEYALMHQPAACRGGQTGAPLTKGVSLRPRLIAHARGTADGRLPPARSCAAGLGHSVVVCLDGSAFSFGCGPGGSLGHGGSSPEPLPRRVDAASLRARTVISAACGASHTLLLCADGSVLACGCGEEGALGVEDARDKAAPVSVPLPRRASAVAAGGAASLFLCPAELAQPAPLSVGGAALEAALSAAEGAEGAAANERALARLALELGSALGSVRGVAAAFLQPPCPPAQPAALDFARLERVMVRALSLGLRCADVITALRDAASRLVSELEAHLADARCAEHAAAVCALLQLPLLSTPQLAAPLLGRLLPLLQLPPPKLRPHLLAAWASAPAALLASRTLRPLQAYLTAELQGMGATTPAAVGTIRLLALLQDANLRRAEPVTADEFYNEFISSHFHVVDDFRLWATGGAAFTFCAHPFLLTPAAKAKLLRLEAALRMTQRVEAARAQAAAIPPESPRWLRFLAGEVGSPFGDAAPIDVRRGHSVTSDAASPSECGIPATAPEWCVVRVRRRALLQDALGEIGRQSAGDLFKPLRVHFIGEEGVDAGGLKKEFFLLLMDELIAPEQGLFVPVAQGRLRWLVSDGPPGTATDEKLQSRWRLVGSLLGLALFNGVILQLHLPQAFWRRLLGAPVGMAQLEEYDPAVARSLRSLLSWAGPGGVEDTFCLSFTTSEGTELEDGGAQTAVTEANRERYVSLLTAHLLVRSSHRAFDALRASFLALCGGLALRLVTPAELEILCCGTSHLDFRALQAAAQYTGGWDASHPTVRNLWQVVTGQFSLDEQKAFLRFVTGSDRAPIGGLGALQIVLTREGPDSSRLPSAHTCFSQLVLPEYGSRGKLAALLRTAICESSGFGLV